jgi:hypothetical protein
MPDNTSGQGPQGSVERAILERVKANELQVTELIAYVSQETAQTKDDAVAGLINLRTEKKLVVEESKPYATLASYTFSPYSLWFWAALVSTLLPLGLIYVVSGPLLYLRYVFGGILVLFLPGFALIELLYAKREELDDLTRFALSIGLSLALVPLAGLALNYTPFGIRLLPIASSLAGLTIVFLVLAVRRKHAYYKLAKNVW